MKRAISTVIAAFVPLVLGACASKGDFPSLAIRESERVQGTIAAPITAPTPPAPETALQLEALSARARAGHAAFQAELPAATRAANAARGANMGSEAWSVAQVALAALESKRSDVMIALADIDRILADASISNGDLTAVAAASAEANGLVEAENAAIAGIHATIGS
jgi:hypothetical protein